MTPCFGSDDKVPYGPFKAAISAATSPPTPTSNESSLHRHSKRLGAINL